MTREEAIEILKAHHMWTGEPQEIIDVRKENKALEMAIQALSQEPCEDAIDRAEAMTEIMMSKSITAFDRDLWIRTKDAVHILRKLPSVTQKSGKWILTIEDWNKWTCSKCGYVKRTDIHVNIGWKYCPNCGSAMKGE